MTRQFHDNSVSSRSRFGKRPDALLIEYAGRYCLAVCIDHRDPRTVGGRIVVERRFDTNRIAHGIHRGFQVVGTGARRNEQGDGTGQRH